jgi:hypothetical protein
LVFVRGPRGLLPDTPALPAGVAGVAALGFVLARLERAAHGNITRFIMAAPPFSNPRLVPHGLYVGRHGYDGQFFYRLALNPTNLHRLAYGIRLDSSLRLQRIGYPALTWLFTAGDRALVPVMLVAVNVVAMAGLGWFGGVIAREGGRHALWGLTLAGYFGFVVSLGRDLSEIVAAGFAVAGLVALRRHFPVLAGVCLSAAVLTRETTVVVVLGYGLVRLAELARRRSRPGRADVAWILPAMVFAGWQLTVRIVTGEVPLLGDRKQNISTPFVAVYNALRQNLSALPGHAAVIWFGECGVLVIIVVVAAFTLKTTAAPIRERLAWLLAVVVALSLSSAVWGQSYDELRTFGDLYVLSWLLLLGSTKNLRAPAVLVALSWIVLAVRHVGVL